MNRISKPKSSGINASYLRVWGFLFVVLGAVGSSIIMNRFLQMGQVSNMQLLEAMQSSKQTMMLATAALVLQAVQTCAVPIFCFLLVEGVTHTSDFTKYFLRVLGLAVLSEIPYNFAMSGKLLDFSGRNPVFGLVLCLVLIYLFKRYEKRSFVNFLMKIAFVAAAVIWVSMLKIDEGGPCILLVVVLWLCRNKKLYRNFIGSAAAASCCIFSPFYLASPMGFMAVYFYNGEKGNTSRLVSYLTYPAVLLLVGLTAQFAF